MDQKTKGAWVVHHMNKLRQVTSTNEFETLNSAGKLGVLLSGLSASETSTLSNSKTNALAKASGISSLELPTLLAELARRRLIVRGQTGIEVLGVTSQTVLTHTAAAFEDMGATAVERAVIDLAESASQTPIEGRRASEFIADTYKIPTDDVSELLAQAEEIGFVDAEEIETDRKLYFNGNIFRRETTKKLQAVLNSLKAPDQAKIARMEQLLKELGCVTVSEAESVLGKDLFRKLQAVSLYDVSEVSNETESTMYVTRPAAFGKFGDPFTDDALDLAKAFVTCLKYGMTRREAGVGRITMLRALMRKLIAGDWVGPATAIGQDYKVLELKRVVEIKHEHGSMYLMRLLKREVGEMALQVLTEGDASEQSLTGFPGASVSQYKSPEEKRATRRKRQTRQSKKETGEILLSIRTGGSR